MAKYLIRAVETYRVANEEEAKKTIEEAKNDSAFTLSKYSSEYKCTKTKGEISDEWYRVILTKDFNVEKEPDSEVKVTYDVTQGYFPSPVETTEEENDDNEGIEF